MVNKICVYTIAKNESKNVDAWVESMKEADAIVVLDTGSTDDTVEKLKKHGVHVEQKIYDRFRFDVARNDALGLVPDDCNILFSTDLDERFEPGWAQKIKSEWVEGQHTRGHYSMCYRESNAYMTRNWCHSKDWKWKYPCHECLVRVTDDKVWYYPDETLDMYGKVILRHYPDVTKSRALYLGLLRIRYKENPDDAQSFLYLIRELTYAGLWGEVRNNRDKITEMAKNCSATDAGGLLISLGDAYKECDDRTSALAYYFEAMLRDSKERKCYTAVAKELIESGNPLLAKEVLLKCLRDTVRNVVWSWIENESLWTWEVYDWLCVACYWAGEYKEAVAWASLALKEDPDNQHIKDNLRLSLEKMEEQ